MSGTSERGHRQVSGAGTTAPRRAVFGGTFDPPHIGHLILAEWVRVALGLEEIVFAPAAQPPHKRGHVFTPALHRVMMVQLAIASNPHFSLSLVDVNRPGPHYTADSVRLLSSQWGGPDTFFYLIGADSLVDLPKWHRPQEILRVCPLAVVDRPGVHVDLESLERVLPGVSRRVVHVEAPLVGISSTEIRRLVAAGRSIKHLVPEAVEAYIREHGLYEKP